ncbi:MAG: tyrosine-type recombinase/integrase [Okeania sp. SIO2D1]|nr:tyrosine-type recombinase/integrase [Okeania sp. SIO2D1]
MTIVSTKNDNWQVQVSQLEQERSLWQEMVANKRSPHTKKAYEIDLRDFFQFHAVELSQSSIMQFLQLDRSQAIQLVLKFRRYLVDERKLKAASVNRKINSIKALVRHGHDVGCCPWRLDVEALHPLKVEPYRDTRGVSATDIKKILSHPDRTTLVGKRDYAMLMLLWGNGLRSSEVIGLDISDIDLSDRSIWIKGKGKSDKQQIRINNSTVEAIRDWLQHRVNYYSSNSNALFISLSSTKRGERLNYISLYYLVDRTSEAVGISKKMSPHRVRHSAITAVLERNGGNIRKAQSFSRHADPKTLMVYDDNLQQPQAEMSDLLEVF